MARLGRSVSLMSISPSWHCNTGAHWRAPLHSRVLEVALYSQGITSHRVATRDRTLQQGYFRQRAQCYLTKRYNEGKLGDRKRRRIMPRIPGMPGNSLPRFGAVLQNYRLMRGMSVDELATAVNLAPSAIRTIEANQGYAPSKDIIKRIATALHLEEDERDMLDLAASLSSPFIAHVT